MLRLLSRTDFDSHKALNVPLMKHVDELTAQTRKLFYNSWRSTDTVHHTKDQKLFHAPVSFHQDMERAGILEVRKSPKCFSNRPCARTHV